MTQPRCALRGLRRAARRHCLACRLRRVCRYRLVHLCLFAIRVSGSRLHLILIRLRHARDALRVERLLHHLELGIHIEQFLCEQLFKRRGIDLLEACYHLADVPLRLLYLRRREPRRLELLILRRELRGAILIVVDELAREHDFLRMLPKIRHDARAQGLQRRECARKPLVLHRMARLFHSEIIPLRLLIELRRERLLLGRNRGELLGRERGDALRLCARPPREDDAGTADGQNQHPDRSRRLSLPPLNERRCETYQPGDLPTTHKRTLPLPQPLAAFS